MAWSAILAWIALLALAGAARLAFLTDWLGYDECQHYLVAQSAPWSEFAREFSARAHPPLYYLVLAPFVALGSAAWVVRLPSLLCGLVGVALGQRLLRLLVGPGPAAFAGALALALLPAFVRLSVEARGYALCLVFVLASWLAALRLRETRSLEAREHAGLAAWLGLALATEYAAIFHAAALWLVVVAPLLARLVAERRLAPAARVAAPYATVAAAAGSSPGSTRPACPSTPTRRPPSTPEASPTRPPSPASPPSTSPASSARSCPRPGGCYCSRCSRRGRARSSGAAGARARRAASPATGSRRWRCSSRRRWRVPSRSAGRRGTRRRSSRGSPSPRCWCS
jgi:hypothetical protein